MKSEIEVILRRDAIENKYLKIIYSDIVEDINYSDDCRFILLKIYNIDGWERLHFKKNYFFRNTKENELKIRDILISQIQKVKLQKEEKIIKKDNDECSMFKIVAIAGTGFIISMIGVPLVNVLCLFVIPSVFMLDFLESIFFYNETSADNYGPYAKFKELIEQNNLKNAEVRNDLKPKVKSK